jgi:hypothetical protein
MERAMRSCYGFGGKMANCPLRGCGSQPHLQHGRPPGSRDFSLFVVHT